MSFYTCMSPNLYADGGSDIKTYDYDFYIKKLTKALNAWMKELGAKYGTAMFPMVGTVTAPNGAQVGYSAMAGLKFTQRTITEQDVKDALWNGDPAKSFPKLWDMIGKKIKFSFRMVNTALGAVASYTKVTPLLNTSHFENIGEMFTEAAKNPAMTPELFLSLQDQFLNLALTSTPVSVVSVKNGAAPGGSFNGTVTIKLIGI